MAYLETAVPYDINVSTPFYVWIYFYYSEYGVLKQIIFLGIYILMLKIYFYH
jgi:hypothetical protein